MVEEIDFTKLKISEKDPTMYLDLLEWLDTNWNKKLASSILTQFQNAEVSKTTIRKIDRFIEHKIPNVSKEIKCAIYREQLYAMLWYYDHQVKELREM